MNFAVMDFVAAGRGEFRVCGQSAAYVRPDYVPAGLLRWENATKRIFCGKKRLEGPMKKVSPRSPAKIILTEVNMWVNMQP